MANRNLLIDIGENVRLDATFLGASMTISNAGKALSTTSVSFGVSRSQRPRTSGKLFFAAKCVAGLCALGVATQYQTLTTVAAGQDVNSWGGYSNNSGSWGWLNHAAGGTNVAAGSGANDWLFVAVDIPNGLIWIGHSFAATPTVISWVGGGNPANGSLPTYSDLNTSGTIVANQVRKFYVSPGLQGNGSSLILFTDYQNLSPVLPAGFTPWGEIAFISSRPVVTIPTDTQYPAGGFFARYYDPRIRADGDPEYTRSMSVWPWGAVAKPSPPITQIDVENGDGGLDFLLQMNLRDAPITGWLYDLGAASTEAPPDSSAWIRAFTLIADNAAMADEQSLRFTIKDKLSLVDKPVQSNTYGTTPPNVSIWNQPVPFGLGYTQFVPLTTYDVANLEFDLGFQTGQIVALYDQGVAITQGVGYVGSSTAATDGVRRLTNPAGKQCASINAQTLITPQAAYQEPFLAFAAGAPTNYIATLGANCTLTNPSGTLAEFVNTVAAGANNKSTMQPAYAPAAGTYVWFEIVCTARVSGHLEVVTEPVANTVTAASTNVVLYIDKPGTYRFAYVKGTANRAFGIQWGKDVCDVTLSGAGIFTAATTDSITTWATELFVNRGGLLAADIDTGGTIATLNAVGYTLNWFQTTDNANILDIFQAACDAHTGSYWQDRNGLIKVGRLVDPAPLAGTAVATFDSTNIFGDVVPADDPASNLSASLAGVKNFSPHAPSELAGAVINTALGAQLQQQFFQISKGTSALDSFYANAITRAPQQTCHSIAGNVTLEANRVTAMFATRRRFWTFQAFLTDSQSYTIEPYQIVLLAITDRYNITSSVPLVVVTATSRFLSDLVSFVIWG